MDQLYRMDAGAITDDELAAILFAVVQHFSKVYLFLDGLDECRKEVQTTVLSIVNQLSRSVAPTVKIFISSRDEHIISTSLKEFPRIRIAAKNNSDDIVLFVEETVKSNIRSGLIKIHDISLESEIISALTSRAHGMFLWAHF